MKHLYTLPPKVNIIPLFLGGVLFTYWLNQTEEVLLINESGEIEKGSLNYLIKPCLNTKGGFNYIIESLTEGNWSFNYLTKGAGKVNYSFNYLMLPCPNAIRRNLYLIPLPKLVVSCSNYLIESKIIDECLLYK